MASAGWWRFLRREAVDELTVEALAERARVWLFEHRYVIPARRRINSRARAARQYRDRALIARAERSVRGPGRRGRSRAGGPADAG
jgi:hypothetical protein